MAKAQMVHVLVATGHRVEAVQVVVMAAIVLVVAMELYLAVLVETSVVAQVLVRVLQVQAVTMVVMVAAAQ
jgi:hypothetical protein